jgi:hypothetical protein
MEFITELYNAHSVLFGLIGILVCGFIGLFILQWFSEKTGVKTDKLQEGLKDTIENAQEETAKELKKSVEKITFPAVIDTGNGESVTIIQREIKEPAKNKYAVRDDSGKFAKVDSPEETPKRKAGRPRKVQQ